MAKRTLSLVPTNATDAQFRAWINEIHNALIAYGWTQATGVGTQIDFATVLAPTLISTSKGYAIYYAGDTLQATAPLFIKLEFGSSSNSASNPALWIQVGIGNATGADSTGALLGSVSARTNINAAVTVQTTVSDLRTAGSSASFRILWRTGTAATQIPIFFAIERDQSTAGADTGNGVNVCAIWQTGYYSQFVETLGGIGAAETIVYALVSAQLSQTANNTVGVGPIRCVCGVFRNPMKTAFLCSKGDFASAVAYQAVIYGVARTYFILSEAAGITANGLNSALAIGILWES